MKDGGYTGEVLIYGQTPSPMNFLYKLNLPGEPILYSELLEDALSKGNATEKIGNDELVITFKENTSSYYKYTFDNKKKELRSIEKFSYNEGGMLAFNNKITLEDYISKAGYKFPTKIVFHQSVDTNKIKRYSEKLIKIAQDSIIFDESVKDLIIFEEGTVVRDFLKKEMYRLANSSGGLAKEKLEFDM